MPAVDQLRSAKPPWLHLVVLDREETPASVLAVPSGFAARTINGRRTRTKRGLLSEFARALDFPANSGHNWDAFEELLADLEWLPAEGYLLMVTDADELLADDPEDYPTFVAVTTQVAEEWATPQHGAAARRAVPFHICLVVAPERARAREDWGVPRLLIDQTRG